jgi:hypothetical protein
MEAARRMVGGEENDAGLLSAMGIPQDKWDQMRGESILPIWPENWAAVEVFSAMQTQWRVGMNGPTGLDYTALPPVMDLLAVQEKDERAECFAGMRVMEREALEVFGRNRGRQ